MAHVRGTRFVLNVAVSAALAAGAVGVLAQQQPYPSRPVRLIVPLAPGGTTDIMARTMAQQLAASLGQQVIVENRAGAGGTVGSDFVAKSRPSRPRPSSTSSSINGRMSCAAPASSCSDGATNSTHKF